MLTFDQATQELHAHDRAVAQAIRNAANTGDDQAAEIIKLYSEGVAPGANGASAAPQAEFLRKYEVWRIHNASFVTPIAQSLGFPLPLAIAPQDTFGEGPPAPEPAPAVAPAPAPAIAPVVGIAPQVEPAPVTPAETPPPLPVRQRKAWSQTDIVKFTKAMLRAQEGQHTAVMEKFITEYRPDLTMDAVAAKAVELELLDASLAPQVARELSEGDKQVIRGRVEGLAPSNLAPEVRSVQYKYAATHLRELIKQLNG